MAGTCPSCGGYMMQVDLPRSILLASRLECPACYRSPFSKDGWRKDSESPLVNTLNKGVDVVTGTITWGIILLVLGGAALLFLTFSAGVYAVDWQFSRWIESRSGLWGNLYFWGPKLIAPLFLFIPYLLFTKRS